MPEAKTAYSLTVAHWPAHSNKSQRNNTDGWHKAYPLEKLVLVELPKLRIAALLESCGAKLVVYAYNSWPEGAMAEETSKSSVLHPERTGEGSTAAA